MKGNGISKEGECRMEEIKKIRKNGRKKKKKGMEGRNNIERKYGSQKERDNKEGRKKWGFEMVEKRQET
jgi:hypothetical protein